MLDFLLLLFGNLNTFLEDVCKVHFNQHTSLSTILSVTITNREEMLVESLANIWSEDEVILILFIDVMH